MILDWFKNTKLLNAARFKAIDGKSPSQLGLYDSDITTATNTAVSDSQKSSVLKTFQRLTYSHIETLAHPEFSTHPDTYFVFLVSLNVKEEGEEEFNKWYGEEHLVLLSKIPGYLRGRRYKLVDQVGYNQGDEEEEKPAAKYLAIYDMTKSDVSKTPESAAAANTTWWIDLQKRVVIDKAVRIFEVSHASAV